MSALLLKLKLHAQEELSEEDLSSRAGLDRVRAALSEAMDAVGDAYGDEAVRADAKDLLRSFTAAVDHTVRDVGHRITRQGS